MVRTMDRLESMVRSMDLNHGRNHGLDCGLDRTTGRTMDWSMGKKLKKLEDNELANLVLDLAHLAGRSEHLLITFNVIKKNFTSKTYWNYTLIFSTSMMQSGLKNLVYRK